MEINLKKKNMKSPFYLFTALVLMLSTTNFAQNKYATQTGHIWFVSKASETVQGDNKNVASFMDINTGEIAMRMLVKSFKFEQALLEEHFNENYMESDKFPKAEFKGKITNLADVNFQKEGIYNVIVTGDITIHGVTKPMTTNGTLEVKGTQILAKSTFKIVIADYGIEIPSIVRDKIAESLNIEAELIYDQLPPAKK